MTVFPAHSSDRWEMKASLAQLGAGFIQLKRCSTADAPNDRLFQPFIPLGTELSRVAKPQRFGTAVTRNVTHDTTSTCYLVRQAPVTAPYCHTYNHASGTNRWIRWYRSTHLTRATLPAGRDTFPARVTSNCPCHILTIIGTSDLAGRS